jgi:hypothetical protein
MDGLAGVGLDGQAGGTAQRAVEVIDADAVARGVVGRLQARGSGWRRFVGQR